MCGNPKVGSVSVFRNPNRTVAKKSNPNFGLPRLFLKNDDDENAVSSSSTTQMVMFTTVIWAVTSDVALSPFVELQYVTLKRCH